MYKSMLLVFIVAVSLFAQAVPFTRVIDNADGTQTFDIVISLYRTPTAAERIQYEEIIQSMADAVWETTNQGHFLGTVRIFQDGHQGAAANIIWNHDEWPRAATNRFNTRYGKIWVGDIFNTVNYLTTAANRTDMGYTLGHEWSHFVYACYDQYVGNVPPTTNPAEPWNTDVATVPSIMNDQWQAGGGNFEWINYDTPNNFQTNNAHGRVWGVSGWELLTQPVADDPLHGNAAVQPARTSYTALLARAPTAASTWTNPNSLTTFTWMQVDLDAAGANPRRDLNIVWMEPGVDVVMIIDRSSSMLGTPITNAKSSAKLIASFLPAGNSAIGVTSFSSDGYPKNQTDVAMTEIPDPVGNTLTNVVYPGIDAIAANGATALYDGAQYGLNLLSDYIQSTPGEKARLIMLLSDGADNSSSITSADVIQNYKDINVPLFTFGYRDNVEYQKLQDLSSGTGGEFWPNLTSAAELQNAYSQAIATTMGSQIVPETWVANTGVTFTVDNTMNSVTLTFSYQIDDASGSVGIEVRNPNNMVALPSPTITQTGAPNPVSYPYTENATVSIGNETISANPAGTWFLDLEIDGSVSNISGVQITSNSQSRTPELVVENVSGVALSYPSPFLLTAAVIYERLVSQLAINASIKAPDGSTSSITMYDDGTHGDVTASDGVYSAIFSNYSQNGDYYITVIADNHSGSAVQTEVGISHSIAQDGSQYQPTTPTLLGFDFARKQQIRVNVTGVVNDDHGNDPGHSTVLPVDNTRIAGKIEVSGDMDYFRITQVPVDEKVIIRVSDVAGMVPNITVYQPDGITEIASATHDPNAGNYVMLEFEQSTLPADAIVVISDASGYSGGIYAISAGSVKVSDLRPPVASAGGPYTGVEGTAVTFDASESSDINGDELTFRWDFNGDGTWDTDWLTSPTAQYTWDDDFTGSAVVEVSDGVFTTEADAEVTIANVAPSVTVQDTMIFECCDPPRTITGTFTDPGTGDSHVITWDFGDGTTESGSLTQAHRYCQTGNYLIILSVEDDDGGIGKDTIQVTVLDRKTPVINSLNSNPSQLWPVNHRMIPVTVSADVTDQCDPNPVSRIISIESNQASNGGGDGNTDPDWTITGDLTCELRAERSGNSGDRIYTITVESRDASDNVSTGEVTVIVPHNQ